ncbi:hypothetical protein [Desmospora activa]|uniref:Uncharacterized protein n=1 Tax=Desmospora activa DSM 45169 TaxID=1121389 RepID=A0A2T4Z8Y2_9BACL|nr:hypothetical protein [Desmospora activa]PTM58354.1 hypothetical protein C8J48_0936 [Desmospora activa DSM 45169]
MNGSESGVMNEHVPCPYCWGKRKGCRKCKGGGRVEKVDLLNETFTAQPGNIWVFTDAGRRRYVTACKIRGEEPGNYRIPGTPVYQDIPVADVMREKYKMFVPSLWVAKGYVKEAAGGEDHI